MSIVPATSNKYSLLLLLVSTFEVEPRGFRSHFGDTINNIYIYIYIYVYMHTLKQPSAYNSMITIARILVMIIMIIN